MPSAADSDVSSLQPVTLHRRADRAINVHGRIRRRPEEEPACESRSKRSATPTIDSPPEGRLAELPIWTDESYTLPPKLFRHPCGIFVFYPYSTGGIAADRIIPLRSCAQEMRQIALRDPRGERRARLSSRS